MIRFAIFIVFFCFGNTALAIEWPGLYAYTDSKDLLRVKLTDSSFNNDDYKNKPGQFTGFAVSLYKKSDDQREYKKTPYKIFKNIECRYLLNATNTQNLYFQCKKQTGNPLSATKFKITPYKPSLKLNAGQEYKLCSTGKMDTVLKCVFGCSETVSTPKKLFETPYECV